jgi:hypothetical protein
MKWPFSSLLGIAHISAKKKLACMDGRNLRSGKPKKMGIELKACLLYTEIRFNLPNGGDQWPK